MKTRSIHRFDNTNIRWGTVRLRMMLWIVALLALILGALGGVVRYTVQGGLFAMVDRILAGRAHAERPLAEQEPIPITIRTTARSRLLDPMTGAAARPSEPQTASIRGCVMELYSVGAPSFSRCRTNTVVYAAAGDLPALATKPL